ncbi:MAG: A24 family peptidase [Ornithinimicrobium sp.]
MVAGVFGIRVGRWLRLATYRKPDEEVMPLPGSRWWVAPVLGVLAWVLTWRTLFAPPAQLTGAMFDPGSSAGVPSFTQFVVLLTLLTVGLACVCLAAMDMDVHRLPDRIMWPTMGLLIVGLSVAAVVGGYWWPLARMLICAVGSGAFYLTLSLVSLARGSLALGLGDVKLSVVLGAALGWFGFQSVVLGLYAGFLVGGLVAAFLLVTKKVGIGGHLAYGPPMMLGAMVGLLLPPDLLTSMF